MNYRLFYTFHAFCGGLIMLQLIFRLTWLPFHLLSTCLALLVIFRFHHCRWARFELCLALLVLYFFRLLLLFVIVEAAWLWYLYYLLLFVVGLGFLIISLRLFFC